MKYISLKRSAHIEMYWIFFIQMLSSLLLTAFGNLRRFSFDNFSKI